jgi:2,4-diaminopentanoate dehydrogenase
MSSAAEKSSEPVRVSVWGPGTLGLASIRELILLPETDLVSVLAYADAKAGKDAGELAGVEPVGVQATTSVDDFLDADPECVIYAARDFGDFRADDDIVMLLEKGIDVITPLPYHYPQMRGQDVYERLQSAALRGGATLFGTGINPGFMFERLALMATGLCNGVERLALREYVNVEHIKGGAEFLTGMGFGMESADPQAVEAIAGIVANYLTQYLHHFADATGLTVQRIEREDSHVSTPVDIDIPDLFTLRSGTVALVGFTWTAYTEEGPTLSTSVNWYATDAMRPDEVQGRGDDCWIIEISGRPSAQIVVELFGTLPEKDTVHPENPAQPCMLSTAIPMIQAIPAVRAAEPGVKIIDAPQFHWKHELRETLAPFSNLR